jgi:hypothetical protein
MKGGAFLLFPQQGRWWALRVSACSRCRNERNEQTCLRRKVPRGQRRNQARAAGRRRQEEDTGEANRGRGEPNRLTPLLGVEHELDGGRVVVGVDDAHAGVLGPELDDLALQRHVVHPRQRVHLLDAPALGAVHLRLAAEDGQVHREAADGQHAGHHQLLGALGDQLLHAGGDGVDDVGNEVVDLGQGPEREQRGVVVVPAELADDEQGPPEQVTALCS